MRCSIDGCNRPVRARTWCAAHYQRWQSTGDALGSKPRPSVEERIAARIEKQGDGCWLWTGQLTDKGYGSISVDGRMRPAHRVLYEMAKGAIDPTLVLDHLCRNRACVNPDHLRVVTHRENILAGEGIAARNARKTRCPRGHRLDTFDGRQRRCSTCDAGRVR